MHALWLASRYGPCRRGRSPIRSSSTPSTTRTTRCGPIASGASSRRSRRSSHARALRLRRQVQPGALLLGQPSTSPSPASPAARRRRARAGVHARGLLARGDQPRLLAGRRRRCRSPSFYAYAAPEPAGFKDGAVRPAAAYYHRDLGEFLLPYEAVRTSASPDRAIQAFVERTYDRGATLAGWDRAALERVRQSA